jgi:predicted transcriptional regulator
MSTVISIRVDDKIKKEIETLGYTPSKFIKKILVQELKRERSLKALKWLKKHRLTKGKKPAEIYIREDRDRR